MRYLETILKLLFLTGAVFVYITKSVTSLVFLDFLFISLLLGIVLILNKDASYHFKQSKRDLRIRKIEGCVLIIFSTIMYITLNYYA
jgi:hypothetical protein